jgi:hypothetical protein
MRCLHQLVHIVVVARDALPAVPQFAAAVVPLSQAVQDDDLVPEGALRLYGGDVAHGQIQRGQILCDVWHDRCCDVRVQRRLRTGLDLDG